MVRVFADGPVDGGSIPGRFIPKTQKWYLMPPCLTLSIIRYESRVKCTNREPSDHPRLRSPTLLLFRNAISKFNVLPKKHAYLGRESSKAVPKKDRLVSFSLSLSLSLSLFFASTTSPEASLMTPFVRSFPRSSVRRLRRPSFFQSPKISLKKKGKKSVHCPLP